MTHNNNQIVVLGAGIVGVSCALWLQKSGFQVTLVDPNQPGSITSSGNACTIADYGCIPVNNPGLVKRIPSLLFSKNSPLSINPLYALTHLPWMLQFLKNCHPQRVRKIIDALGRILNSANAGLDPLIKDTNTEGLFVNNGCMYVYKTDQEYNEAKNGNDLRAHYGAPSDRLDNQAISELEPALKDRFKHGVLFQNARQVLNPQTLVTRYMQTFTEQGGQFISQYGKSIEVSGEHLITHLDGLQSLSSKKVVVACGAFSKEIQGAGMNDIPLDTERGYHIQFSGQQARLSRPVAWVERGFYATPMNEGLRFAGTVELAGLNTSLNQRQIKYLTRQSKEMIDIEGSPDQEWLGFRPTLPDALPVIGPSMTNPNIVYAFGHQHIGLTLAGITGKLIAEYASENTTSLDLMPYSPARFR